MLHLMIKPGQLSLKQLRQVSRSPVVLSLDPEAISAIAESAQVVEQVISEGRTVYGINTGFGLLANTKIAPQDLETLQKSIVLSHAAGIGELMSDETVRLMMLLKINSLARGYSGIRLEVIQALIELVNNQIYPCVPKKGSVGASGDLAPLAHMSTVLLGEGQARYNGKIISGLEAMKIAGLEPITLALKKGSRYSMALKPRPHLRSKDCLWLKICLPPPLCAVRCRSKPLWEAVAPSIRVSTACVGTEPKWMLQRRIVTCSMSAAKLANPTVIVKKCKILTLCAANHK